MSYEHIGVGTDDSLLCPGHAFHEQNSHGPGDAFMVSTGEDLHMWKEHGIHIGEKPFEWKEYWRAFCDCCSLTQHVRNHTGEKPVNTENADPPSAFVHSSPSLKVCVLEEKTCEYKGRGKACEWTYLSQI